MYFQSCWLYTRSDHPVRCSRSMSASVLVYRIVICYCTCHCISASAHVCYLRLLITGASFAPRYCRCQLSHLAYFSFVISIYHLYDILLLLFCGLMSLLLLYMYFQSCWLYTRSDHPACCSRSMSASVLCLPHCHLLLYMSLYIRFGSRLLSSHCLLPVLHLPPVLSPSALPLLTFRSLS